MTRYRWVHHEGDVLFEVGIHPDGSLHARLLDERKRQRRQARARNARVCVCVCVSSLSLPLLL
jgi:hypothetical protein